MQNHNLIKYYSLSYSICSSFSNVDSSVGISFTYILFTIAWHGNFPLWLLNDNMCCINTVFHQMTVEYWNMFGKGTSCLCMLLLISYKTNKQNKQTKHCPSNVLFFMTWLRKNPSICVTNQIETNTSNITTTEEKEYMSDEVSHELQH